VINIYIVIYMNQDFKKKYFKYKKKYLDLKQKAGFKKMIPKDKIGEKTCNEYLNMTEAPAKSKLSYANTNWNNCKEWEKNDINKKFDEFEKQADEYLKEIDEKNKNIQYAQEREEEKYLEDRKIDSLASLFQYKARKVVSDGKKNLLSDTNRLDSIYKKILELLDKKEKYKVRVREMFKRKHNERWGRSR